MPKNIILGGHTSVVGFCQCHCPRVCCLGDLWEWRMERWVEIPHANKAAYAVVLPVSLTTFLQWKCFSFERWGLLKWSFLGGVRIPHWQKKRLYILCVGEVSLVGVYVSAQEGVSRKIVIYVVKEINLNLFLRHNGYPIMKAKHLAGISSAHIPCCLLPGYYELGAFYFQMHNR